MTLGAFLREGLALDNPAFDRVHRQFHWALATYAVTTAFWCWAAQIWTLGPLIFLLQTVRGWYTVVPNDTKLKQIARSMFFGAGAAGFAWAMKIHLLHDV